MADSSRGFRVQPHTLYVVGTPIGNLDDMTFRAIQVLRDVDLIAAEDTRHTGKLLHHFQITTKQISFYDHNQAQRIPALIQQLEQGAAIALVSDAGMPGISDPGYELVAACVAAQITVVPIPGASAGICALSASGLPTDRYVFEGFLPTKPKLRRDRLQHIADESRTIILYEAPHRILSTLQDLAETLGAERSIVLARELTKRFEDFWRGDIAAAIAQVSTQSPQGEFTLIIQGVTAPAQVLSESALKSELQTLMTQGLSRSQASRTLAQRTHKSRRDLYQLALTLPDPHVE